MRTLLSCLLFCVLAPLARADEQAEAQAIVDKAVKAHGGAEKLAAIKAETWKTKDTYFIKGQAHTQTSEWSVQGADQIRQATDNGTQKMVYAVNGNKGMITRTGGGQTVGYRVENAWIAEQKEQHYARTVTTLQPFARKDKGFKLAPLGDSKVEGKAAVGVVVSSKDHRDIKLYFDKKDGLLLKAEYVVKNIATTGGGKEPDVQRAELYADYKEFAKIQRPTKVTVKSDGNVTTESVVTDYQIVDKLEEKLFNQ